MSKLPRIIAIVLMVAGVVMIVAGGVTYYVVHRELADEHITVSDDATNFQGEEVTGPFTAYAQATVIKKHAMEIADGKTYAELDQDDPNRDTVMTASFLRASLFTSIVAFGVAFFAFGLGIVLVLVGVALVRVARGLGGPGPVADAAPEPAPAPA